MVNSSRIVTSALSLLVSSFAGAQSPLEYSLDYAASANGIAAIANRSLTIQPDQTFRLSNTLEASLGGQVVARIEQVSTLQTSNDQIQPVAYSYQQTGLSQETQAINYNWDAFVAVSAEDDESWTIELSDNTFDQLSHQLALRQELVRGSENLEFAVIDEDEIETHRYRILREEIISTALGNLNSTVVERLREDGDERNTVFWLANDWQFVLVRMEQTNSGLTVVLELNAGNVAGMAIQPLN